MTTNDRDALRQELRTAQARRRRTPNLLDAVTFAADDVCEAIRQTGATGSLQKFARMAFDSWERQREAGKDTTLGFDAHHVCCYLGDDTPRTLQLMPPEVCRAFNRWKDAEFAVRAGIGRTSSDADDAPSGPRM